MVYYKNFCVNDLTICTFIAICINYGIIIIHFLINLIKPNLFSIQHDEMLVRNNNEHIINYTTQQDIYINVSEQTNIVNYIVDNPNYSACAICLDEQKNNECWSILNCTHEYHNKCISNWLKKNNTCPTCRYFIN